MRLFSGVLASIIASLLLGFFPSVAEAEQNPCDPDSESYDARVCFEHVRALEASEKSAKRDLVLARRETTVAKSQLKAVTAEHTLTSNDLRIDIASRAKTIQHLETTVKILSEEKEIAWGYVDVVSKVCAAAIGLVILGGSMGFYFLRKSVSDYDRYSVEVRDAKIRELEVKLRNEERDVKVRALKAQLLRSSRVRETGNVAVCSDSRNALSNALSFSDEWESARTAFRPRSSERNCLNQSGQRAAFLLTKIVYFFILKQYVAAPGKKLKIEKVDVAEGGNFVFTEVLLTVDDADNIIIGTPTVPGATVNAKVLKQARTRKVVVFKYRPKARWRKKRGHRQHYTEVEIIGINTK